MSAGLIVTLKIEQSAQDFFQKLRLRHFPAERNFIEAHITLFHYLPLEWQDEVVAEIESVCLQKPFSLAVESPRLMGNGVMFPINSDELMRLHFRMQNSWRHGLKPQDLQGFRPHIVVQNKVTKEIAEKTLSEVALPAEFVQISAAGISLWQYLNGPWQLKKHFLFL